MAARDVKHSAADSLRIFGPAVVLAVAAFVLAYQFVDPAPPRHFTLATAGVDGSYHRYAQRYKALLAREGIRVDLLETAGSTENLERLRSADGAVQVAFVQGGVGRPAEDESLVSLASLYFEPLWVFRRSRLAISALSDLAGRRIAVGPEGSGTRAIALELLRENAVNPSGAQLLDITGAEAASALAAGQVDAVFIVSGTESAVVRELLHSEGATPMSFRRADAYTRRHRYLSSVTLPEGVIDLARNVPAGDITLVAPAATLVARGDFHPALVDLLLEAADEVHRDGGVFERYGQFPSPEFAEFPLSEEARRHFKSGPKFLRRVLPFWAATLVERMLVMLLPLLALLIPLIRIMPPVYRWRIRSRIYRWYAELLAVDPSAHVGDGPERVARGLRELERIEDEVVKVHVPLSYADQLYALRVHIELVRDKLRAAARQAT